MAVSFAILIPFAFLPTYATQALAMAYPTAASLIGILALSGIVGKLSLGHLSDNVGRDSHSVGMRAVDLYRDYGHGIR